MSAIESNDLLRWAMEAGFDSAGICEAIKPPHYAAYMDWLAHGRHGAMAYLERHAAQKQSPESLLEGAKSLLVVALGYNQHVGAVPGAPRIARYALGRDYHKVVRQKLRAIGRRITEADPKIRWRACVDTSPLMERDYAQLAGIGWFGKNTMLIDSHAGSWFVLGSLILDRRFEPTEPAVGSCGTCRKCVDACPTGAIVHEGGRWQVDARRCVSYLTIEYRGEIGAELRHAMGDWTFGCDVCQEVCPFNAPRSNQPRRAEPTKEFDFLSVRTWPELRRLALLSSVEWDLATRGSAVRRSTFEGLKRNALINLENADRSTREADSGLESSSRPTPK